jgi:tetratricopeptide (TPR) repeat protein
VGLGTLALARHEFEQGLAYGEQAREQNPYKAAAYSVIGDAQVELGRYGEARATVQALVDLRPDLTSYARVSYIRELNGDLPGAIDAMRQAVTAGSAGTEALAWTRVQLGHLYFNSGDLAAAQKEYERTLFEYPDYLHARAGLARLMAARGDYAGAAALYLEITRTMPLPEYVIALADVQRAAGNTEEAARTEQLVEAMDRLYRANGVRTDVEMALFRADRGIDPAATVEAARQALAVRPGIHASDALAWALYQAGRYEEAQAASDQALRLGTRDSLMHFHAGMIAAQLVQTDRARSELTAALTLNPHFSVRWADQARETLKRLGPLS